MAQADALACAKSITPRSRIGEFFCDRRERDVIVWRASDRAVVEYTKGGKRWAATFWVDEEDGFPHLAHSTGPADDPDFEGHWAKIVSEREAWLEAGLKRLR